MIGSPGPFQIIRGDESGSVDSPIRPPRRRYLCENYSICLNLSAALNWDNFTCRGCCGEVDQSLIWRAKNSVRNDKDLTEIIELPEPKTVTSTRSESDPDDSLNVIRLAAKS